MSIQEPQVAGMSRVHAWALIAFPLLLLASSVAFLSEGGVNDGVVGGTIGVWSSFALAIGFVGLSRALEGQAPRGAMVLLVIGVIAACAGVAFNVQAMYAAQYDADILLDSSEGAAPAIAFFAFLPWGWLAPVTFIVAGVLVWRTKVFVRWAGLLLVAGGVLFVTGRPARIDAIVIATDLVLAGALVPIGLAMLSGRAGVNRETRPVPA
jgi:hypothetical protein